MSSKESTDKNQKDLVEDQDKLLDRLQEAEAILEHLLLITTERELTSVKDYFKKWQRTCIDCGVETNGSARCKKCWDARFGD